MPEHLTRAMFVKSYLPLLIKDLFLKFLLKTYFMFYEIVLYLYLNFVDNY